MGSTSDWPTMEHAATVLDVLGVAYESRVISAHRTPDRLVEFSKTAEAEGFQVIIAGAGGAAHLPQSAALSGMDSLLSIAQMPGGVPVGTLAIGKSGAKNAGLLAASILALSDAELAERLRKWRAAQTAAIGNDPTGNDIKG